VPMRELAKTYESLRKGTFFDRPCACSKEGLRLYFTQLPRRGLLGNCASGIPHSRKLKVPCCVIECTSYPEG